MDHFNVCVPYELDRDFFRHLRHAKHTDIFVPELAGTYVGYPVGLMISIGLPVTRPLVCTNNGMRKSVLAPESGSSPAVL